TGGPFVVGQREQEQLAGDELIAAFPRFLVGEIQQIVEIARHADLAAGAFDLRQSLDRLFERRLQPRHGNAGPRQQRRGPAVFLRQHCRQQMLRLDEAGVVAEREALGVGERLLKFGRQFVEAHGNPLSTFTVWVFAVRFQHRRRSFERKQRSRRVARPESANTCLRVPGATVSVDPPPPDGRTTSDGPCGLRARSCALTAAREISVRPVASPFLAGDTRPGKKPCRCYCPTICERIGPRIPSSSPFSFSGTLNLSSDFTRSSTSVLNCASVMFMPLCAVRMSRPVYMHGPPVPWQI